MVILKNAMLFADGHFRPADISVSNGQIAAVAGEIPSRPGAVSIDLSHLAVFRRSALTPSTVKVSFLLRML